VNQTTKFDAVDSTGQTLARCDTWLEAARECMQDDGYVYELRRIDTNDCVKSGERTPDVETVRENYGAMALWVKSSHHGNNSYAPTGITSTKGDFTGITSDNDDDTEAEEECLREYQSLGGGGLHPRFANSIRELTFENGLLAQVDDNLIEAEAESLDMSIDEVRAHYSAMS
jgi:hypothetical protein